MSGPRWKKGKDSKDFSALAAASPMSSTVAELQSSLKCSNLAASISSHGKDAVLGVNPHQAILLNQAAFGRFVENAGAEKQWFQLGAEEVFLPLPCFEVHRGRVGQREADERRGALGSLVLRIRVVSRDVQGVLASQIEELGGGWCGQACSMVQIS
jgi:tRNA-splicing endonuclease subunit Sen2